ncbi:hypothetical protein T4B_5543, partial [Trichinella pseudospiralis]
LPLHAETLQTVLKQMEHLMRRNFLISSFPYGMLQADPLGSFPLITAVTSKYVYIAHPSLSYIKIN